VEGRRRLHLVQECTLHGPLARCESLCERLSWRHLQQRIEAKAFDGMLSPRVSLETNALKAPDRDESDLFACGGALLWLHLQMELPVLGRPLRRVHFGIDVLRALDSPVRAKRCKRPGHTEVERRMWRALQLEPELLALAARGYNVRACHMLCKLL